MPFAIVFLKAKRTFCPAGVFGLKADAGTPASEIVDLMVWMTFVAAAAEVAGDGVGVEVGPAVGVGEDAALA